MVRQTKIKQDIYLKVFSNLSVQIDCWRGRHGYFKRMLLTLCLHGMKWKMRFFAFLPTKLVCCN